MKNHLLLLISLLVACSVNEQEAFESLANCELRVGAETLCGSEGLPLCLVRVVTDSRCPINAQCIWAGAVEAELKFGGELIRLALHPGKPEAAMATVDRHTIRLLTVDPFPVTGQVIDPADYVLVVEVD